MLTRVKEQFATWNHVTTNPSNCNHATYYFLQIQLELCLCSQCALHVAKKIVACTEHTKYFLEFSVLLELWKMFHWLVVAPIISCSCAIVVEPFEEHTFHFFSTMNNFRWKRRLMLTFWKTWRLTLRESETKPSEWMYRHTSQLYAIGIMRRREIERGTEGEQALDWSSVWRVLCYTVRALLPKFKYSRVVYKC